MEKDQTHNQTSLSIGGFTIAYSSGCASLPMVIPPSGLKFCQSGKPTADFHVAAECSEPDRSETLLFGSEQFYPPIFLYQSKQGEYDWQLRDNAGNTQLGFLISPDWNRFTLYQDATQSRGIRAFQEFGTMFPYAVLNHHACVLHGVVMEYAGKGILVTAPSGTGKTTHTRMWQEWKRALILNGDRCLCRKLEGIWYAYGMPWSGSSGESMNRSVPISCIVNLKRGKSNVARPMSVFDGCIYLMQRIFAPVWPGVLQRKGLDLCAELAVEIPMLELSCRPDLESVEVLEQAVRCYGR